MAEMTVLEAVREALAQEMARDERVLVFGEDVGRLGGVFRATDGLLDRFGPERVVDMPMAETAIAGLAVGLAMRGLRPVAEIQFADFIHACMDHLVGEAAKIRWRTNGDWTCPMVLRTAYGGGFRGGPYHSQSVEAFYSHAPGLKVVAPSTPADAKGLLLAAIRDPDPVLVLEHKRTYRAIKGDVPEGDYVVEIGKARTARAGSDVTVCAYGMMLHEALAAAETLAAEGILLEVIDLRTLSPLDGDAICASVEKTGRLCVVHEDTITMGLGAEIVALVTERVGHRLRALPVRVASPDVPGIPVTDELEDEMLPDRSKIAAAIRALIEGPALAQGSVRVPAYDASTPQGASVVGIPLRSGGLAALLDAIRSACAAFPQFNARFDWERGVVPHPELYFTLDLGPGVSGSDGGTFTVIDYGPDSSLIGFPAVRPNQTAALRVGAIRDGSAFVTVAVDHRAIDGADVGRFLAHVRERLTPLREEVRSGR
jgi:2-oxoisovalerate dehydrogenase E1 component beta subunit